MKTRFLLIATVLCYGLPAEAAQQMKNYAGLQYALVTYAEEGFDDVEPTALVGRIGTHINEYFSGEARLGFGLQDDSLDIRVFGGDAKVDLEVEYLVGVYGVLQSRPQNGFSVYGVLGFSQAELKASAQGISVSDEESGLSYGIGANYKWFNLEYMSYLDEASFEVTALSLGFLVEF